LKFNPVAPARYDEEDVAALKAVAAGNASAGQQKRALSWIVHRAAMTYDEMFVQGQADTTNFLTGRRNVGLQIMKLVNVPVGDLIPPEKPKRKGPSNVG
jgi:hypothetical protein